MTDAELHATLADLARIARRGGYDVDEEAEKMIRVVRHYAEDFAAAKLREAADAWDMDDDLMFDSDSLRHRADVLHTYRASDRP